MINIDIDKLSINKNTKKTNKLLIVSDIGTINMLFSGTKKDFEDLFEIFRIGTVNTPRVIGLNKTAIVEELSKKLNIIEKQLKED